FHGYELAKRWGLDEPRSTWHLRTAAVARQILDMGYTAIRDAGGLGTGFRVALQEGLIPGPPLVLAPAVISPTGRRRAPPGPVGPPRAGRQRSVLAVERRRRRRGRADDRPHHGPRRRGRDQVRDDRRRQLARRARAQGFRVLARGDEGARRRSALARPPRHVP